MLRDRKVEGRALASLTLNPDSAALSPDCQPAEGQAEARPPLRPFHLAEGHEDLFYVLLGDSRALICD